MPWRQVHTCHQMVRCRRGLCLRGRLGYHLESRKDGPKEIISLVEELGLHAAVATHLGTRASHRGGRMVSGQQGWDGEDLAEEAKHERKCHHARVAKEGCPQGVRVKKRKMGGAYRPKSEWGPFTCTNWSSLRGGEGRR